MGFDPNSIGTDIGSGLGVTANANTGMATYGDPTRYNSYAGAYQAQDQYEGMGLRMLGRQGAQIPNPYGAYDQGNSANALSWLGQQAGTNMMGADNGQSEYMRQANQANQANIAAARSTAGGSLAQAGAMRDAGMAGALGQQNAAQGWSQQQILNQEAGAAAQAQTLGMMGQYGTQLSGMNQQNAYNQGNLQQQQNALNQGTFNQLTGMGQQAQLAQLNAYLQSQGLSMNQQQFNTGVGNQMTMGMVGGLSGLAQFGGQQGNGGGGGGGFGGGGYGSGQFGSGTGGYDLGF